MKKVVRYGIIILISLLTLTILYIGYQYIHLRLYVKNEEIIVAELTSEEKVEDFRYLTGYVRECYPYGNIVEMYKGLDNIVSLEEEYIRRAGETKDNLEFLNLFIEYSYRLGQAGHWGIQWLDEENYSLGYSYMFDIPKDAFYKTNYWLELSNKLGLYVHSDIKLKYLDGNYMLTEDYRLNEVIIPKDSIIDKVNGQKVDDYVKALQSKQILRYDHIENKVYTDSLFMSNPGDNVVSWDVEYILPNSDRYRGKLKKYDGYKDTSISKVSEGKNILCRELDEQTGYIKIFSFLQDYIDSDYIILQEFMGASSGKYKKLIIDIRGNIGGEPASWMENLVRPLLKQNVTYDRITAVKKSYFSRMNLRYGYYRLSATNDLLERNRNHITDIRKIKHEVLEDREWNIYRISKELSPKNSFPFEGKVYVIADNDTVSAADSFINAVKEAKVGTVIGTPSLGWGNVFIQPNLCAMPNSGLMLQMDVEMPWNSDGTVNAIFGVKPDVNLAPSTYPTPYPIDFDIKSLIKDPWILWVMNR